MSVSLLVGLLPYWNYTNIGISPVLDEISFWIFLDHLQIISNFLYVCRSVSWLTSLLKLNKSRDISSSGWDIFLKFFGDIPGMLVHYFQIILNLMFVCQSVCLLTSLPKLDKGISPDLDETSFWNFLKTFLILWHNGSNNNFVCLSVW